MKKISSKHNLINFNVDSKTKLSITSDGIIVSDEIASFVLNRLGNANVSVQPVDIDEAVKNVLSSTDINNNI